MECWGELSIQWLMGFGSEEHYQLTFDSSWGTLCVVASTTRTCKSTAGRKSSSNFTRMPFVVLHSNLSSHRYAMGEMSGSVLVRSSCWMVLAEKMVRLVKSQTMMGLGKLLGNEFVRVTWWEHCEASKGMGLHWRNWQIYWCQLIRCISKSGSLRDQAIWHKWSPKPSFIKTLANSGPQPWRPMWKCL